MWDVTNRPITESSVIPMGAEPAPFSPERSGDVNVVNLLPCRASFNEALGKLQLPSETFVLDAYAHLDPGGPGHFELFRSPPHIIAGAVHGESTV